MDRPIYSIEVMPMSSSFVHLDAQRERSNHDEKREGISSIEINSLILKSYVPEVKVRCKKRPPSYQSMLGSDIKRSVCSRPVGLNLPSFRLITLNLPETKQRKLKSFLNPDGGIIRDKEPIKPPSLQIRIFLGDKPEEEICFSFIHPPAL